MWIIDLLIGIWTSWRHGSAEIELRRRAGSDPVDRYVAPNYDQWEKDYKPPQKPG
jgi:hypothetical protein